MSKKISKKLAKLFTRIAQEELMIETLEVRNADSLDFHDVQVKSIMSALEQAYIAGYADALKKVEKKSKVPS